MRVRSCEAAWGGSAGLRAATLCLALTAVILCLVPGTAGAAGAKPGKLSVRVTGLPAGARPDAVLVGKDFRRVMRVRARTWRALRPGRYELRLRPVTIRRDSGTVRAGATASGRRVHVRVRAGRRAKLRGRYGTIINPGVRSIETGVRAVQGNPGNPRSVVLAGATDVVPGTIVSIPPAGVVTRGILSIVRATSRQGDATVLQLEAAPVQEVAPSLDFVVRLDPEPSAKSSRASCSSGSSGIEPYRRIKDITFAGGWNTKRVLRQDIKVGARASVRFTVEAGLDAKASFGVECALSASVSANGMAGPIPVTAAIEGELSAYAGAGARFDAGGSVRVEAGAETIGVPPAMAWKPNVEFKDPEFHFSADRFAEARAGIGVAVKAGIGNEHITSATLKLGNELAFTGRPGACDWKATFGQFSVEGQFLGWDIETPKTPPLYSKKLWESRCGAPRVQGAALGKVVRTDDGARFYIDKTGHRHAIDSDAVHACHGGESNTAGITDAQLATYPAAERAACFSGAAGDIIRHPDGDSYVLEPGAGGLVRRWIPSAADYVCARAEANRRVVEVARYHIAELRPGGDRANANCIIRGPGGDSHFINNEGRREWIPDTPTWDCERGRGVRVLDVPAGFAGGVAEVGWHFCFNMSAFQRKIIRHADGDASYVHPDNTRTWIPDSPTWDCRMRQGVPVVDTRWREYVNGFKNTGWDYCFDPVLFRGRVLRHADGDSHYVHPDDTRTWIPDSFTWNCRMNQGRAIVNTRWREYVNRFRDTGWDYCYDVATMRNRILTHPDGDSHFVDSAGVRHWIPSGGTFVCLRNRGIPADTVRWRDYITRTPERDWAVCGDTITTGQKLDRGQWLQSGDGRYKLHMQTDGNLVLYNASGRAIWATNRTGQFVIVQSDGNLVQYNDGGAPVWSANTVGTGANRLVIQSDGNLVLYAGSRAVWATGTVGR